ncbi:hypothetical protein KW782_03120 [Candidatus Parcubacteria bacterium]|nr:hypothetical protein [Candidatus Parcubacteria bacterium]
MATPSTAPAVADPKAPAATAAAAVVTAVPAQPPVTAPEPAPVEGTGAAPIAPVQINPALAASLLDQAEELKRQRLQLEKDKAATEAARLAAEKERVANQEARARLEQTAADVKRVADESAAQKAAEEKAAADAKAAAEKKAAADKAEKDKAAKDKTPEKPEKPKHGRSVGKALSTAFGILLLIALFVIGGIWLWNRRKPVSDKVATTDDKALKFLTELGENLRKEFRAATQPATRPAGPPAAAKAPTEPHAPPAPAPPPPPVKKKSTGREPLDPSEMISLNPRLEKRFFRTRVSRRALSPVYETTTDIRYREVPRPGSPVAKVTGDLKANVYLDPRAPGIELLGKGDFVVSDGRKSVSIPIDATKGTPGKYADTWLYGEFFIDYGDGKPVPYREGEIELMISPTDFRQKPEANNAKKAEAELAAQKATLEKAKTELAKVLEDAARAAEAKSSEAERKLREDLQRQQNLVSKLEGMVSVLQTQVSQAQAKAEVPVRKDEVPPRREQAKTQESERSRETFTEFHWMSVWPKTDYRPLLIELYPGAWVETDSKGPDLPFNVWFTDRSGRIHGPIVAVHVNIDTDKRRALTLPWTTEQKPWELEPVKVEN